MSYYRDQLEAWLKTIEIDNVSVLDIGGGEKTVRGRVGKFNAKSYRILDLNAEYKPDFFGDLNYIIDIDQQFDVIFCLEVFEYIWNPVQAIENISSFLWKDGVAYISFPTIYPVHNPFGMDYLRYTKFGIERLLAAGGFTWEITPRIATVGLKKLSEFFQFEGMHPLKNSDMIYHIGYLVKAVKIRG